MGMTEKEAIEIINNVKSEEYDRCYCLVKLAREMAIKALEKQIAKKPTMDYPTIASCPICDEVIYPHTEYCPDCGQKLDWGNEDAE